MPSTNWRLLFRQIHRRKYKVIALVLTTQRHILQTCVPSDCQHFSQARCTWSFGPLNKRKLHLRSRKGVRNGEGSPRPALCSLATSTPDDTIGVLGQLWGSRGCNLLCGKRLHDYFQNTAFLLRILSGANEAKELFCILHPWRHKSLCTEEMQLSETQI